MKYSLLILAVAASLCLAGNLSDESINGHASELKREHEDKRDKDGQVVAHIDTVYRGKERILSTITLTKKSKYGLRVARAYYAGGKEVLDELEYDNGRPQTIRLFKDDVLYEEFQRRPDGSVEPVSGEELARIQAEQRGLMETLKR
jgi:hypothetical protein